MTALALLYGAAVLWLAYEVAVAPVIEDEPGETPHSGRSE